MRYATTGYATMAWFLLSLALTGCGGIAEVQDKARAASVKANMRTVQIAAESYAVDKAGEFPKAVDDAFKSYFPGGGSDGKTPAPDGPTNPFDNKKEWPTMGNITDVAAARAKPVAIPAGNIQYSCIGDGKSYAIVGGAQGDQQILGDDGQPVVFSNQDLGSVGGNH